MKKYILIPALIFDFLLTSILTVFILSSVDKKEAKNTDKTASNLAAPQGNATDGFSYNFLLLGYGGAGHDGANLSDVIMIAHIKPSQNETTFISVPRDLWVEIPVRSDIKQSFKINAAYAIGTDDKNYGLKEPQYRGDFGGGNMTKKVVSDISGLQVHNFVAVDFESFKKIVDILGGIEVDVPVTFNDYSYPIKGLENETCGFSPLKIAELHQKYSGFDLEKQFTCRYEHLHFDKGVQKMNGEKALKFVRSRHSGEHGGDFARSERQKAVLMAMKDKMVSLNSLKNIDELYVEFKKLVKTDLDLSTLKNLNQSLGSPKNYKINFLSLTEENVLASSKGLDGQFILVPKEGEKIWTSVQKYIYDQLKL